MLQQIDLRLEGLAAAEAGGADPHALVALGGFGLHGAEVHAPAALGDVVGVTDVVTGLRPFAANFANLCHDILQMIPEVRGETMIIPGKTTIRQGGYRGTKLVQNAASSGEDHGAPPASLSEREQARKSRSARPRLVEISGQG